MQHLGDITKIDGHKAPLVDIVTGGSPCQDLSVAGKRAGLAGERSGLFMEQIRIIKGMRDESAKQLHLRGTNEHIRPRYLVWENVPGALSSPGGNHKGEDFQAVLTEIVRIAKADAPDVSLPADRKWPHTGCLVGVGDNGQPFSVAYRLHDAQFWGVPQRRKRIALVADFGGITAPEILFERKGVSGDSQESGKERKGTAGGVKESTDRTVYCLQGNGIDRADTAGCNGRGWRENQSYTLNTIDRPAVYDARGNGNGKTVPTITGDHENRITDYTAVMTMQAFGTYKECGVASGLKSRDYKDATDLVLAAVDCRNGTENESINGTLQAKSTGGIGVNFQNVVRSGNIVRRLTPLECERLQGFPDNWTNIGDWVDSKDKKHKGDSDSPRYKALGNSIALPFWEWMAKRMVGCLKGDGVEDPTMASLFDGIGGFPLAYSRAGCDPVWASEIEEFPIAVTKMRFPDKEKKEVKE